MTLLTAILTFVSLVFVLRAPAAVQVQEAATQAHQHLMSQADDANQSVAAPQPAEHDHSQLQPAAVESLLAGADMLFQADLTAASEAASVDSIAVGRAVMALMGNTAYLRVMVSDIDNVSASHIHEGAPGAVGGIVVPLFDRSGGGQLDALHPVTASFTLDAQQIDKLKAGLYYVNVHSNEFPAGEIRGQLRPFSPPTQFNALMVGSPPITTTGVGLARFSLIATDTLAYEVAASDLVSVTVAHIHRGGPGENGGVVAPLNVSGLALGGITSGTATLSGMDLVDLLTNHLYANIHTAANPAGEVRGQLNGASLYQANLSGASEIPPVVTAASGNAVLALSADARTLAYRLTLNNIDKVTLAHIHKGALTQNGGVAFDLIGTGMTLSVNSPVSGILTLTPTQVLDLIGGRYYVNVHSGDLPAGEMRGQVLPFSPPAHMLALMTGASELPPVAAAGRGVARFTLNQPLELLHYAMWVTDVVDIRAAHIHLGRPGVNGGVIHMLYPAAVVSETFGAGDAFAGDGVGGAVQLSAPQWVDLLTGYYYANVHTTANPGGAMRGQIGRARFFASELSGANQAPPITTVASGSTLWALDEAGTELSYRVTVTDINNILAAHIHRGTAGANGEVIATLYDRNGDFAPGSPLSGTVALSTSHIYDLLAGKLYINVHTQSNTSGEIRDQLRYFVPPANYVANLSGAAEVPPVASPGQGIGYFVVNVELSSLQYAVGALGIANPTAAHIHRGAAGKNGPVVYPFYPVATAIVSNPLGGGITLTNRDWVDLLTQHWYVNLHTQAAPGGELRGQIIVQVNVPTALEEETEPAARQYLYLPVVSH
jgi:hypothetical protein